MYRSLVHCQIFCMHSQVYALVNSDTSYQMKGKKYNFNRNKHILKLYDCIAIAENTMSVKIEVFATPYSTLLLQYNPDP